MAIIIKTIALSFLLIFSSDTYARSVDWSLGSVVFMYSLFLVPVIVVVALIVRAINKVDTLSQDSKTVDESIKSEPTTKSK